MRMNQARRLGWAASARRCQGQPEPRRVPRWLSGSGSKVRFIVRRSKHEYSRTGTRSPPDRRRAGSGHWQAGLATLPCCVTGRGPTVTGAAGPRRPGDSDILPSLRLLP